MQRRPSNPHLALGRWELHPSSEAPRSRREGWWEPATDIFTSGQAVVIKMELAGVRPDMVDLTVDGRLLRVRGERPLECPGGDCEYRQVEISYGRFERAFEFPFPLGDAKLAASCADGFLTIRVEPAASEPRRIEINRAEQD
ncbi:MAG: Hsp20/alpha crystallin family protein [Armatimonadetes bacterium]|nr:Hsp20/alpha crystallin family protein [Armatimonadota bacterium]